MSNDNEAPDSDAGGEGVESAMTNVEPATDEVDDDAAVPEADDEVGDEALDRRAAELDRKAERLDQREDGLDKRAEDLKARTEELDGRESNLRDRRRELDDFEAELDQRRETIEQREADLDERQAAIEQRESELDDRAAELDRVETTLQNYVSDDVEAAEESLVDTVQDAVWSAMDNYADQQAPESRLGTTGNLVLGLAGLVLVAGGVGVGLAAGLDTGAALFDSAAANYGVAAVLALIGLGTNLAAATNRV
jgi:ribonuclease Y